MTGRARNSAMDDEARWAEAMSLLDRMPTESAQQRMRRGRRLVLLTVVGIVLVTSALAALVATWVSGRGGLEPSGKGATWQVVVGLTLSTLGLVLALIAIVAQFRSNRRLGAWRNPLFALRMRQRRDLLAQMRGRRPADPARVPLTRYLAEAFLARRPVLVLNIGLFVSFVGQWLALRTWWYLVLAGAMAAGLVVATVFMRRDERLARRFLAEHPDVGPGT